MLELYFGAEKAGRVLELFKHVLDNLSSLPSLVRLMDLNGLLAFPYGYSFEDRLATHYLSNRNEDTAFQTPEERAIKSFPRLQTLACMPQELAKDAISSAAIAAIDSFCVGSILPFPITTNPQLKALGRTLLPRKISSRVHSDATPDEIADACSATAHSAVLKSGTAGRFAMAEDVARVVRAATHIEAEHMVALGRQQLERMRQVLLGVLCRGLWGMRDTMLSQGRTCSEWESLLEGITADTQGTAVKLANAVAARWDELSQRDRHAEATAHREACEAHHNQAQAPGAEADGAAPGAARDVSSGGGGGDPGGGVAEGGVREASVSVATDALLGSVLGGKEADAAGGDVSSARTPDQGARALPVGGGSLDQQEAGQQQEPHQQQGAARGGEQGTADDSTQQMAREGVHAMLERTPHLHSSLQFGSTSLSVGHGTAPPASQAASPLSVVHVPNGGEAQGGAGGSPADTAGNSEHRGAATAGDTPIAAAAADEAMTIGSAATDGADESTVADAERSWHVLAPPGSSGYGEAGVTGEHSPSQAGQVRWQQQQQRQQQQRSAEPLQTLEQNKEGQQQQQQQREQGADASGRAPQARSVTKQTASAPPPTAARSLLGLDVRSPTSQRVANIRFGMPGPSRIPDDAAMDALKSATTAALEEAWPEITKLNTYSKPERTCALTPINQGCLLNRIGASSIPGLEQVYMLNKTTSPLMVTGSSVNPCTHGDFFALAMYLRFRGAHCSVIAVLCAAAAAHYYLRAENTDTGRPSKQSSKQTWSGLYKDIAKGWNQAPAACMQGTGLKVSGGEPTSWRSFMQSHPDRLTMSGLYYQTPERDGYLGYYPSYYSTSNSDRFRGAIERVVAWVMTTYAKDAQARCHVLRAMAIALQGSSGPRNSPAFLYLAAAMLSTAMSPADNTEGTAAGTEKQAFASKANGPGGAAAAAGTEGAEANAAHGATGAAGAAADPAAGTEGAEASAAHEAAGVAAGTAAAAAAGTGGTEASAAGAAAGTADGAALRAAGAAGCPSGTEEEQQAVASAKPRGLSYEDAVQLARLALDLFPRGLLPLVATSSSYIFTASRVYSPLGSGLYREAAELLHMVIEAKSKGPLHPVKLEKYPSRKEGPRVEVAQALSEYALTDVLRCVVSTMMVAQIPLPSSLFRRMKIMKMVLTFFNELRRGLWGFHEGSIELMSHYATETLRQVVTAVPPPPTVPKTLQEWASFLFNKMWMQPLKSSLRSTIHKAGDAIACMPDFQLHPSLKLCLLDCDMFMEMPGCVLAAIKSSMKASVRVLCKGAKKYGKTKETGHKKDEARTSGTATAAGAGTGGTRTGADTATAGALTPSGQAPGPTAPSANAATEPAAAGAAGAAGAAPVGAAGAAAPVGATGAGPPQAMMQNMAGELQQQQQQQECQEAQDGEAGVPGAKRAKGNGPAHESVSDAPADRSCPAPQQLGAGPEAQGLPLGDAAGRAPTAAGEGREPREAGPGVRPLRLAMASAATPGAAAATPTAAAAAAAAAATPGAGSLPQRGSGSEANGSEGPNQATQNRSHRLEAAATGVRGQGVEGAVGEATGRGKRARGTRAASAAATAAPPAAAAPATESAGAAGAGKGAGAQRAAVVTSDRDTKRDENAAESRR
ncbi:hypothetical protein DUNSADRAFT_1082 [Dunaliella salina]|uniref:Uncharacterized protein n=1 Tax=Dunaliella salina TaxID=3046 RepID=A0ABQ7GXH3_DUNSA|nr:hypothetical protein DUNSADRAFT_1082 [Dunaliella salina]|eukprot:KAF5839305.1 hypothetical protein DUNSADRAFT_1082 [Dunaliella salina]